MIGSGRGSTRTHCLSTGLHRYVQRRESDFDWGTALCFEYRLVPISIDDVEILPGDFLFGDIDGMQEIPMGVVEEVLAKAEELSGKGKPMRKGLGKGQEIRYLFEKTKAF